MLFWTASEAKAHVVDEGDRLRIASGVARSSEKPIPRVCCTRTLLGLGWFQSRFVRWQVVAQEAPHQANLSFKIF